MIRSTTAAFAGKWQNNSSRLVVAGVLCCAISCLANAQSPESYRIEDYRPPSNATGILIANPSPPPVAQTWNRSGPPPVQRLPASAPPQPSPIPVFERLPTPLHDPLPTFTFAPPREPIAEAPSTDVRGSTGIDEELVLGPMASKEPIRRLPDPPPVSSSHEFFEEPFQPGWEGGCDLGHFPVLPGSFGPDPDYSCRPYDPCAELSVYEGKYNVPTQRPLIELGRGLYRDGEIPPYLHHFGAKNSFAPTFLVYGDFRTGLAYLDDAKGERTVWANRLNLDMDLKLTATERIHAFVDPLNEGGQFTRLETIDDNLVFVEQFDDDFDTFDFEGDLGYIWGGMTDQDAPFDLPFVGASILCCSRMASEFLMPWKDLRLPFPHEIVPCSIGRITT